MGYDTSLPMVEPTDPPPPPPPPPPSAFDTDIQAFIDLLGQNSGRYSGVADTMQGIASGADDPAFAAAKKGRFDLLDANTSSQLGEVGDFYGGRGLGGSSADLNTRLRVMQGAGLQKQQIAGDIDLQNISRRDTMLTGQLDPITAMLSLAAMPPALRAQMEAAKNAGEGGGGGGGGGTNAAGTVLCTEAFRRGDLARNVYLADVEWGRRNADDNMMRGYNALAKPLCRFSRRHRWAYRWIVKPMGVGLARHFAHEIGILPKDNRLGYWLAYSLIPVCRVIGWLMPALVPVPRGA